MGNVQQCIDKSEALFNQISPKLSDDGYTFIRSPNSYSFRITWPNTTYGLSISYPQDVNKNAAEYGWVIETALWSITNDKLIYNDDIGYDNICQFNTVDELLFEIARVRLEVSSPDFPLASNCQFSPFNSWDSKYDADDSKYDADDSKLDVD
jgi:hypothetical protein